MFQTPFYVLLLSLIFLVSSAEIVPVDEEVIKTASDVPVGLNFLQAFLKSVAIIVVTELGDKTFFIAAVMAMKHSRLVVYAGALGALVIMTILSTVIGITLPMLIPKLYTHYASVAMFVFFGLKLLQEAKELYSQKGNKKNEELEEVEEQLGVKIDEENAEEEKKDLEAGTREKSDSTIPVVMTTLAIMIQAFTLTFFAEWGDRSQIATISLAAVNDPIGVTIGSVVGHAACTGLAVVGGRLLATRISEKQVALAGGIVFLLFAGHSLYVGP